MNHLLQQVVAVLGIVGFFHGSTFAQTLEERMRKIESDMPPIGTIIDYMGELESDGGDPKERAKQGFLVWAKGKPNWVLLNGATVPEGKYDPSLNAVDSNAFPGLQLPNLIGKFVKATDYNGLGETGGVKERQINLAHSHPIMPCGDATGSNALLAQAWVPYVQGCNERSKSVTESAMDLVMLNNEPPYVGLMKLIRIR